MRGSSSAAHVSPWSHLGTLSTPTGASLLTCYHPTAQSFSTPPVTHGSPLVHSRAPSTYFQMGLSTSSIHQAISQGMLTPLFARQQMEVGFISLATVLIIGTSSRVNQRWQWDMGGICILVRMKIRKKPKRTFRGFIRCGRMRNG